MPANSEYPTVRKWRVTILQAGKLGFFKPATYDFPITGVRCGNPVCINGGFDLTALYKRIVSTRAPSNLPDGEYVPCNGTEKISKRAAPRHACFNTLNVKVEVEYNEPTPGSA